MKVIGFFVQTVKRCRFNSSSIYEAVVCGVLKGTVHSTIKLFFSSSYLWCHLSVLLSFRAIGFGGICLLCDGPVSLSVAFSASIWAYSSAFRKHCKHPPLGEQKARERELATSHSQSMDVYSMSTSTDRSILPRASLPGFHSCLWSSVTWCLTQDWCSSSGLNSPVACERGSQLKVGHQDTHTQTVYKQDSGNVYLLSGVILFVVHLCAFSFGVTAAELEKRC